MKIISNFKDYYDNAICNLYCTGGNNSEVKYVRKETLIELNDSKLDRLLAPYIYNPVALIFGSSIKFIPIGFCGNIYYTIVIANHSGNQYFYKLDTLGDDWLRLHNSNSLMHKKIKKLIHDKCLNTVYKRTNLEESILLIKKHLKNLKEIEHKFKDFFIQYQVPIFTFDSNLSFDTKFKLKLNPNLKNINFFKVIPPTQAYQELEMYLNSVLVAENNPPQITDNTVLLEAKGFDRNISFRHPIK